MPTGALRWAEADRRLDSAGSATAAAVVTALCVLDPRHDIEQLVRGLDTFDPAAVAAAVIRQKVVRLAVRRIGRLAPRYLDRLMGRPELAARVAQLADSERHREAVLAWVGDAAREIGAGAQLIKGAVARTWYADPSVRDVNDVDLMVDSAADAFELTARLIAGGYRFEVNELPWIKATDDGRVYGQINLGSPRGSRWPSVDIHFSNYSVRHCAYLPHTPSGRTGVHHAGVETTIVHLVANVAGDYLMTTKDLNDLSLCLNDMRVDWTAVVGALAAVRIDGFLGVVMRRVLHSCGLTEEATRTARGVVARVGRDRYADSRPGIPGRRVLGTVSHSFAIGRRRGVSTAVLRAYDAWRYYRRPLRLHLARGGSGTVDVGRLNAWTCVRLVPVELAAALADPASPAPGLRQLADRPQWPLCAGLDVVTTPRGALVRAGDRTFVPTVYYGIDRGLVDFLSPPEEGGSGAD
jgi:hypothetical protein